MASNRSIISFRNKVVTNLTEDDGSIYAGWEHWDFDAVKRREPIAEYVKCYIYVHGKRHYLRGRKS